MKQVDYEFIKARDVALSMINKSGAFSGGAFISKVCDELGAVNTQDCFDWLDIMIENGDVVCLRDKCWGQFRIYATPQIHNR